MSHSNIVVILSALLLFSAIQASSAEPPPWQWAQQHGGDASGMDATRIAVDSSGNSYVTGSFSGTAEFGSKSVTSVGFNTDIYLMKSNSAGDVLWVQSAGGMGRDIGRSVSVDADGNIYVTGSFQGTASFESVTVTGGFGDNIFLAKYNSAGALQWVRSGGGSGSASSYAVALDADGNPHITGHFSGTVSFGGLPALVSAGWSDIFVAAYSASGDEQWATRAGGSGFGFEGEGGRGLAVDDAGDVFVAGNFLGTARFGAATLNSVGGEDVFVAKYSPAMEAWLWVSRGGGSGPDIGTDLKVDSEGNVVVAGIFTGTAAFGTTTMAAGSSQWAQGYFVAKYSSAGSLDWVARAGGVGYFAGHGISLDGEDSVYLAATFGQTVRVGDSSLTSTGMDNVYVAKIGKDGGFEWAVQSSGDFLNVAADVAVDASGSIYLAGWFFGTAEFGEATLVRESSIDIYVAKMGVAAGLPPIVTAGLDIRPGSCTNPLQTKNKGVLPVAILGSDDVDVSQIDLSTVTLWRADGVGGAVPFLKKATIEDIVECEQTEGDGIPDLAMVFCVQELVEVLELGDLTRGSEVELVISGAFADEIEFAGIDYVLIR